MSNRAARLVTLARQPGGYASPHTNGLPKRKSPAGVKRQLFEEPSDTSNTKTPSASATDGPTCPKIARKSKCVQDTLVMRRQPGSKRSLQFQTKDGANSLASTESLPANEKVVSWLRALPNDLALAPNPEPISTTVQASDSAIPNVPSKEQCKQTNSANDNADLMESLSPTAVAVKPQAQLTTSLREPISTTVQALDSAIPNVPCKDQCKQTNSANDNADSMGSLSPTAVAVRPRAQLTASILEPISTTVQASNSALPNGPSKQEYKQRNSTSKNADIMGTLSLTDAAARPPADPTETIPEQEEGVGSVDPVQSPGMEGEDSLEIPTNNMSTSKTQVLSGPTMDSNNNATLVNSIHSDLLVVPSEEENVAASGSRIEILQINEPAAETEESIFNVHEDFVGPFENLLQDNNEILLEVMPFNPDLEENDTLENNLDVNHEAMDTQENNLDVNNEARDTQENNLDITNNTTRGRKRVAHPEMWKSKINKVKKNSGEAYVDSKGRERPAVNMKGPCACKQSCRFKFNLEAREFFFKQFWSLGDHRRQWEFITNHVVQSKVERKTVNNTKRNNSRKYYVYIGQGMAREKVMVCKTMFLNTLGINACWIDSAFSHLLQGETVTVSPDKRGKHSIRPNRTTDTQKQTVRDHINSYPRMASHYCRARSSREYLESGLNMTKMYRHYLEWLQEKQLPQESKASKRAYEDIFKTEFNLGFFVPKKDQCSLCNLVKFGTRQEREKYKTKYAAHIVAKKMAQKEKAAAKKLAVQDPESTACLVFDFQKILQCPKSDTSTFFYKDKLSAYNFTVFNMGKQEAVCYMWHEATAKKGADEVASMLFHHFEILAKEGTKKILAFSDSCWSQNKNRFVYAMFLHAAAKFNIDIKMCFLEPGHTHNEGDSVHATIEKSTKNKHIFDFSEWVEAVRTAKVHEPMYIVKEITQDMVFDFHSLVESTQWTTDIDKKKVMWSKLRIVEASSKHVGILKLQYEFNGPKSSVDISQRRGHPVNLRTYKPKQKFRGKIPLKALKIKHIRELCKSLAIPSRYHSFYENVISQVDPVNDDEERDPQLEEDCAEEPDEELDRYMEVDKTTTDKDGEGGEDENEDNEYEDDRSEEAVDNPEETSDIDE